VDHLLQAVVMVLYVRSKAVPAWALLLLCLSRRLHSIFILRLFNDCLAVFAGYVAIWLLVSHHWRTALLTFSIAVSVKMNILLLAPAVLVILLKVTYPTFLKPPPQFPSTQ
jgi:alpha-1,3-mannosyltransferase